LISLFSNPFFAHRSQSVALTSPLQQGATTAWCPLKITPTRRPVFAGFFGEGRQTENAKQSKKKDYENKEKFSFSFGFRALEPDRKVERRQPTAPD
jgi:hypothetical protein